MCGLFVHVVGMGHRGSGCSRSSRKVVYGRRVLDCGMDGLMCMRMLLNWTGGGNGGG